MTAQKLYGILRFVAGLDNKLELQGSLDSVLEALSTLVGAPAQPPHQIALAKALAKFKAAASLMGTRISPSEKELIAEMGGAEFFDPLIAEKVQESVAFNAMTPSVARDFVQDLTSRRTKFLTTVRDTEQGLRSLNISEAEMSPGSAELSFLIPRTLFDNHLAEFAKELKFISQLISDVGEATTGHAAPVDLEQLSSSVPTIALTAAAVVIEKIADVVNKFLVAWKKLEEIRDIRARLKKAGLAGSHTEEDLTRQINTVVDEVVEESTTIVLVGYSGEAGRRNELEAALKQDARRLFGQIERGLTVEFRAEPKGNDEDEANESALKGIANLSKEIQFPQVSSEPLLLAGGEVLEGPVEAVMMSKKTTTRKITTRKETRKESGSKTEERDS